MSIEQQPDIIVSHDPITGELIISANEAQREWIRERQNAGEGSDNILHAMFEGYWTNGSYEPFDAGDGNPFVGLTSAPCIAECMNVEDDGTRTVDRYWYFNLYMTIDPMDELRNTGVVVFLPAPGQDPQEPKATK